MGLREDMPLLARRAGVGDGADACVDAAGPLGPGRRAARLVARDGRSLEP